MKENMFKHRLKAHEGDNIISNFRPICIRRDWFYDLFNMDELWLHRLWLQDQAANIKVTTAVQCILKSFGSHKSVTKILAAVFWDKDRVLLIKYLPKSCTISAK